MSHTSIPRGSVQRLRSEGIAALRGGDKLRAKQLLAQALRINPRDAQSWLWLSGAVETPTEQRFCLERLRELCPNHPAALEGLAQLDSARKSTPGSLSLTKAPALGTLEPASTTLEPVRLSAVEEPAAESEPAPGSASATQSWLRSLLDLVSSLVL